MHSANCPLRIAAGIVAATVPTPGVTAIGQQVPTVVDGDTTRTDPVTG
jgi:hypothetical protein